MTTVSSLYRRLPAVHRLLESPELSSALAIHGRSAVTEACRAAVADLRRHIPADGGADDAFEERCRGLPVAIATALDRAARAPYPRVINATGVLIHTNLGRAPLARQMPDALSTYLALEYDVAAGKRGQRLAPLRERITAVCGGEWAVMVNNNAAALVLTLAAHARDRQVIVSRSQLIEIGGSFRLPDVMVASGCHLVEVGCTNRTHLRDYERAIGAETAAILVAHQSNFRIVGFTASPDITDLAHLAHAHDLPLIVDQGSGALHDLRHWSLPPEETVGELLRAGADIVCFSGDKLLGGPQAGVLVGTRRWVEPLGRHALYRALRPDKTALVLMDEVLRAHQSGQLDRIPLYAMMAAPVDRLKRRARNLARRLRGRGVPATGISTRAALGGGTTPQETMPSWGLGIPGGQRLADLLRDGRPAVLGRIEEDVVVLDLRTVFPDQDREMVELAASAYGRMIEAKPSGA